MKYIDGDLIAEAELAIRSGVPLGSVARRLNIEPEELRQRLGMPAQKPVATPDEPACDLWGTDRLDGVL